MNEDEAVSYILHYLNVPKERQTQVETVIRGAYPFFTMLDLIDHVRKAMKKDYGEK